MKQKQPSPAPIYFWCVAFLLSVQTLLNVACASAWSAQLFVPAPEFLRNQADIEDDLNAADESDLTEDEIDSGASLKTDPELESLLEKAERYHDDGNDRVATKLWQAVLQRSGDALYTTDRQIYFSLTQEVEKTLSQLSPSGLSTYRITADAEAQEILNGSPTDDTIDRITALSTVVGEYFISSVGDDSAFELGAIYLDRFEFAAALRLFEKIVSVYPDPSVPLEQVYLRIALCHRWLGNVEMSEAALEKSKSFANAEIADFDVIASALDDLTIEKTAQRPLQVWSTRKGTSNRSGIMPSPPKAMMRQNLIAAWQFFTHPKDTRYDRSDHIGFVRTASDSFPQLVSKTITSRESNFIDAWKKKNWRPAGQLLFDTDRVFFRSAADLVAFDKRAIERAIEGPVEQAATKSDTTTIARLPLHQSSRRQKLSSTVMQSETASVNRFVQWRSLWRNSFAIDETTRLKDAMMKSWGGYGNRRNRTSDFPNPVTMSEVQYFGDQIASQMSIHRDYFFAIEGPRYDEKNRHNPGRPQVRWNSTFRRVRSNFLTAYDRQSGSLQWRLPRQSESRTETLNTEKDFMVGGGFMSAPIGFGNLIIVPVNIGSAISVYALDPDNGGKTVWKSFLCDEPATSAQPLAAIEMSIDGGDLFINCGMGVIFVLNPSTGMVRFAKRYRRNGQQNRSILNNQANARKLEFKGWTTDDMIGYRDQAIVFSSDRESIWAIDRRSGELIWESEINPFGAKVDYLIGAYDDVLYVGGFETIIAYDLKGQGRMLWGGTPIFDGEKSRGRAMLTPAGIFVPVESTIVQYPLKPKTPNQPLKPLARMNVDLGTGAPLGNLYCDGNRIYVQGANRLYALAIASQSADQN